MKIQNIGAPLGRPLWNRRNIDFPAFSGDIRQKTAYLTPLMNGRHSVSVSLLRTAGHPLPQKLPLGEPPGQAAVPQLNVGQRNEMSRSRHANARRKGDEGA